MNATRSPVRLTVLHDGDYCDKGCPLLVNKHDEYEPESGGLTYCALTNEYRGYSYDWRGIFRTEACKAATAPRSCAGCMHLVIMGLSGTPSFCNKYSMWPARNADGTHVPVLQCDGPEVQS